MKFDWKSALAEKAKTPLEILENFELIVDMAEADVKNILRRTNYYFVVESENFPDFYRTTCNEIIEKKLQKWRKAINNNAVRGVVLCLNSAETIAWIISRISNEIKNLFDARYRNNVSLNTCVRVGDDSAWSDDSAYVALCKLPQKELKEGLKTLWRQIFDFEVIEHLCERFSISIDEIVSQELRCYKIENRQLSWDFGGVA